ncbi:MAG TPA: DegV family protein, partial [Anaerolineae bacterium]|nr:DegV family protein [Anaerolineae bacterium]
MARTSIVTDSTSGLSPDEVRPLGIAMIPVHIEMDARTYHEGVDLSLPEFYQMLASNSMTARTSPPSVREFRELYRRLGSESEEIVAIHMSSALSGIVGTARQAAQSHLGKARVTVFDSRLAALPVGWLALAAAEAAAANVDSTEIVRLLRAMVPRMYVAFFSEEERHRRTEVAHRPAGKGAAAEPLLMIEEGEIVPLERSRSKGRAVDRLYEFVTEFSRLERITVLQGKPLPEALELATMLNERMPELTI